MNTPIGKSNGVPDHFKEGSNEKAKIKYENYDDCLCFWRCLEYDKKNDEIDLIEKCFNVNINVYTNDEPELLQIDRRRITNYDDTLNLMRGIV